MRHTIDRMDITHDVTKRDPDRQNDVRQHDVRQRSRRLHLWRSRWAAIGAAVAVTLGGGTLHLAGATDSEPSSIIAVTPTRILDTRSPVNLGLDGPFVSAIGQDLQVTGAIATSEGIRTVVPAGASGVLLNVTVVRPTSGGFISVRPSGTPGAPQTSNLNFEVGDITPNAVFVALPTSGPDAGRIEITFDAFGRAGPTTDILGDVVGYTTENPDVYSRAEADATFLTEAQADAKYQPGGGQLVMTQARVDHTGDVRASYPNEITAERTSIGSYEVYVARPTDLCGLQATLGLWQAPFLGAPSATGVVSVSPVAGNSWKVGVRTRDLDGNLADRPFHLQVTCPTFWQQLGE